LWRFSKEEKRLTKKFLMEIKFLYAFLVALKGMIVSVGENLFLGDAFGDIFKVIVAFACFS